MPYGYFQISQFGLEDINLCGNPQITFFKQVLYRYTNFAMETVGVDVFNIQDLEVTFSKQTIYKVDNTGDLIKGLFLEVNLPSVNNYNYFYNNITNPLYGKINFNSSFLNSQYNINDFPEYLTQLVVTGKINENNEMVFEMICPNTNTFKQFFKNNISGMSVRGVISYFDYIQSNTTPNTLGPNNPTNLPSAEIFANDSSLITNLNGVLIYNPTETLKYLNFNNSGYTDIPVLAPYPIENINTEYNNFYFINIPMDITIKTTFTDINDIYSKCTFTANILSNFGNFKYYPYYFDSQNKISAIDTWLNNDINITSFNACYTHIPIVDPYDNSIKYRITDFYFNDQRNFAWRIFPFSRVFLYLNSVQVLDYTYIEILGRAQKSLTNTDRKKYLRLAGFIPELINPRVYPTPEYQIMLPLPFWFTFRNSTPLPIVCFKNYPAEIRFNFNSLLNINNASNGYSANQWYSGLPFQQPDATKLLPKLLVEYIFLDKKEREQFQSENHKFLIVQTQPIEFPLTSDASLQSFDIAPLQHPIYYFDFYFYSQYNPYGYPIDPFIVNPFEKNQQIDKVFIESVEFKINNEVLQERTSGTFFNNVTPYEFFKGEQNQNVYSFNFSLEPFNVLQPKGSLNFSKVIVSNLNIKFKEYLFRNSSIGRSTFINKAYVYDINGPKRILDPETGLYDYVYKNVADDPNQQTIMRVIAYTFNILSIIGGFPTLLY